MSLLNDKYENSMMLLRVIQFYYLHDLPAYVPFTTLGSIYGHGEEETKVFGQTQREKEYFESQIGDAKKEGSRGKGTPPLPLPLRRRPPSFRDLPRCTTER